MSEGQKLIPVFVPTLAKMLAFSEHKKGSPLTQAEAEAIRDKCACIMMESADAAKHAESHGYVDVNPQNCWADWHRLRAQMTGGYLPKIILCIPGGGDLQARCAPILAAGNIEHEFRPRDENLLRAFKSSSMAWPCFTPDDFAAIDAHQTVLYVLSENFPSAKAPEIGRAFLKVGRELLDAGGIAIKCDSAGISHSRERWSKFDKHAGLSAYNKWSALFHAYVVYPIGSTSDYYSCGMQLLGAADMIVSKETIQNSAKPGENTAAATAGLFRAFGMYLVAECQTGAFTSGHTFSVERGRSPLPRGVGSLHRVS